MILPDNLFGSRRLSKTNAPIERGTKAKMSEEEFTTLLERTRERVKEADVDQVRKDAVLEHLDSLEVLVDQKAITMEVAYDLLRGLALTVAKGENTAHVSVDAGR